MSDTTDLWAKAVAAKERDAQLLAWWRSVQGPQAGLTGPLIRFAGLVEQAALDELAAMTAERDAAVARWRHLHCAMNDYRAGVMALNPALSAALVAHLPEPQGGDSEF